MNPRIASVAVVLAGWVAATTAAAAEAGAPAAGHLVAPLGVDDCVRIALEHSARVVAAQADVGVYRAQAAQIEALLSMKFQAITFLAPMYRAEGGLGFSTPYHHDLSDWGPYGHADARLIKPLATFGRYTAGVTAARERVAVEEEHAREIADTVRAEVRRLYALRLYALSMKPNLENGKEILAGAIKKAEEMYAADSGEVTLPDLMRLRYGAGEIDRYLRMADDGAGLAALAIKQAMGLRLEEPIVFADDRLVPPEDPVPTLPALVAVAMTDRPEIGQIAHGRRATAAWETAERRANLPVLFAAAAGQADWTPMRPPGYSAAYYNLYNDWFAGVAVGLKFDIDLAAASAHAAEAHAKAQWVDANAALADTGIPLQVTKARLDLVQNRDLARVADDEVKSTRKWMTFSAAAYMSGTGEARDVLEGVGAYLLAKKAYYDHLLGAYQARADLELSMGTRAPR
ncbi:MAG TPA: TolC family protein [Polyangia bacterium]|nr:TolC family protein [Polyangia bacterium]